MTGTFGARIGEFLKQTPKRSVKGTVVVDQSCSPKRHTAQVTSAHVLRLGHGFEVGRADTVGLKAEVVDHQLRGYGADPHRVRGPVREHLPLSVVDEAVPAVVCLGENRAGPPPVVFGLHDVAEQTLLQGEPERHAPTFGVAVSLPPAVVSSAEQSFLHKDRRVAAVHGAEKGGGWSG